MLYATYNFSYIQAIHIIKSEYNYFKRTYKNHKEMLKQYVKDQEEWFKKAKYDEELCYDPDGEKDLKELEEQFSNYFEDE